MTLIHPPPSWGFTSPLLFTKSLRRYFFFQSALSDFHIFLPITGGHATHPYVTYNDQQSLSLLSLQNSTKRFIVVFLSAEPILSIDA